jgi:hypothetical protein
MKTIASALVKAQKSFAPALKTSTNPHFRSKYVDLAGCVEAVIDALNENGIFLMQTSHECSDGVIIETIFIHESGEQISAGKLHVPASKQDAQGYGSALTYSRRYSLMAACGIAPEDDDGNAASKKSVNKGAPVAAALASVPPPNDEDMEYLKDLAGSLVDDVETRGQVEHAFDKLEYAKLDSDQKLILWDLMKPNSKTRSAFKAEGDKRRKAALEAAKSPDLAGAM